MLKKPAANIAQGVALPKPLCRPVNIFAKRIYEERSPKDGFRILVDRLWPRGIKKEQANIDLWLKEIAPSDSLRKWFNHEPEKWEGFKQRYFKELDQNQNLVEELPVLTLRYGVVGELRGCQIDLAP